MSTTQRSESLNKLIKNYVSYKNDLLQFFGHFERLLKDRRYDEIDADFQASQTSPALSYPTEIMKHAASVYTPAVFEQIESEVCKAYDCIVEICGVENTTIEYEVNAYGKSQKHLVAFDLADESVRCSCKKFEFVGILCCHALKVLSLNNIFWIPSRYILKRWTKKAKQGKIDVGSLDMGGIDPKERMNLRYKELCHLCTQLASKASEEESAFEFVRDGIFKMLEDVDMMMETRKTEEPHSLADLVVNKSVDYPAAIDNSQSVQVKVKGIKIKERITYTTSRRPRNALERATRKRRCKNEGKLPSKKGNKSARKTTCNELGATSNLASNDAKDSFQLDDVFYEDHGGDQDS